MARRCNLPPPDFINKNLLAHHLGCSTQSLDNWITARLIPPPHSRPGRSHAVWLMEHYEAYKKTGEWPKAAWNVPASA